MTAGEALYGVVRLTRPVVLNSARAVEARMAGEGPTVGMRAVLEILREAGPLTVPQIARRLDIARQGVQRLVNDLEHSGHLAQQPNPDHKRSPLYAPTADGDAMFKRIQAQELAALDRLASGMTARDIAAAKRVMTALDDGLRELVRAERQGSEG